MKLRCKAIDVFAGGKFKVRCRRPLSEGADLCAVHREMVAKGYDVKRVREPQPRK